MEDEIRFWGHRNVLAFHPRAIEITKARELSLRGDCIIGVNADLACADISELVKSRLKTQTPVTIEIIVDGLSFKLEGSGHPQLSLTNSEDIVIRKTSFVCPRTLSIGCDKASVDMPREMVRKLQDPTTQGVMRVCIE